MTIIWTVFFNLDQHVGQAALRWNLNSWIYSKVFRINTVKDKNFKHHTLTKNTPNQFADFRMKNMAIRRSALPLEIAATSVSGSQWYLPINLAKDFRFLFCFPHF
jgi:hypothetical protein